MAEDESPKRWRPPGGTVGRSGRAGRPTARQMEILEALARDRLEKEIAAELDLRLDTVKKHVAALKRLLGARTRIGVVLRAIEEGWVEPRSPPPSHRAVESMT